MDSENCVMLDMVGVQQAEWLDVDCLSQYSFICEGVDETFSCNQTQADPLYTGE